MSEKNNMILSIIIPVYNGKNNIIECLKSIEKVIESNQKIFLNNIEVLVIDDGSKDSTGKIVNGFIGDKENYKYFYKENGGVSSARNYGIDHSIGKYIWFVDADDTIAKESVNLLQNLEKINSDMIFFDFIYHSKTNEKKISKGDISGRISIIQAIQKILNYENDNNVWSHIYKKELIEKYNIYFPEEISMGEDFIFNTLFVKNIDSAYYLKSCCYKYNVDNLDSAMNKFLIKYIKESEKIYLAYKDLFKVSNELEWKFKNEYFIKFIYKCIKSNRKKWNKEELDIFFKSEIYNYLYSNRYAGIKTMLMYIYVKYRLFKLL